MSGPEARAPLAPHRHQGLEALAIAAAQVHLGAVLQADAPVAADPGRDLGDARDVDHVGFVDSDEALGIELALQLGERGADLQRLAADMEDRVIAGGLDPVDVGYLDHDLLAAL